VRDVASKISLSPFPIGARNGARFTQAGAESVLAKHFQHCKRRPALTRARGAPWGRVMTRNPIAPDPDI
jgi:hypothetical protein